MTSLNLNHYHFKRTIAGITIIGTWIHDEAKSHSCLVLIREGDELNAAMVPCVVAEADAYVFCGIQGIGEPERAIPTAAKFAQMMRMSVDKPTVYKIIKTIEDHIGDLVSIPPFSPPFADAKVIADVVITNTSTGETKEVELRDVRH